jgi:hypothetical protein
MKTMILIALTLFSSALYAQGGTITFSGAIVDFRQKPAETVTTDTTSSDAVVQYYNQYMTANNQTPYILTKTYQ